MKRVATWIMLMLLLVSVFAVAFDVKPAGATAVIVWINSDGSVDPPYAPISSPDNVTYTFTGNISYPTYGGLVIQRSNTVIDGNGYTVQGNESANAALGVQAWNSITNITNVTIKNINVEGCPYGIQLSGSSNCTVTRNNVTGSSDAGISVSSSSNNIVSENNVDIIPGSSFAYCSIWLYSSSNNIVSRNNAIGGPTGDARAFGQWFGIRLDYSSSNAVNSNNVTGNCDGVYLSFSSSNTVSGNNIINNINREIRLYSSSNNIISENNVTAGACGIYLDSSSSNIITTNTIANQGNGLKYLNSSTNTLYHNSLIGNNVQVIVDSASLGNAWNDSYPSGGNSWSDYSGLDVMHGPNQNILGSDGIGDTPYIIDQNNTDSYPLMWQGFPQDLAVTQLIVSYSSPSFVNISATVGNNGNKIENANLKIYANNNTIWSQLFSLAPGSNKTLSTTWNTAGYCGQYQITAYVEPVQDEMNISNNGRTDGYLTIPGKGYFILVAGNCYGNMLSTINYGCNQVYKILRAVGYSADDIYYLNQQQLGSQDVDGDGRNDIDAWSSSANLKYAIDTWARYRVSPGQPLYFYLFDHGGPDVFCINDSVYPYTDEVTSTQLASWINNLQNATGAHVHVIYAACYSGSFINELSKKGDITVTSCSATEHSWCGPGGKWEAFSIPFWNDIRSGESIGQSFKDARNQINNFWYWGFWDWIKRWLFGWYQTPVLDDPSSLAGSTHVGACEWSYPYIDCVMPRLYGSWPPPSNVTLWAKVENATNLANVTAWMLPPDLAPPNSTDTLLSLNLECYEMNDPTGDGNWTVCIPAVNFTNHASAPANFTFFITAEEENGNIATPSMIIVQFTETGEPSPDTVPPLVHVERPLEYSIMGGIISVNGTVSDDVCLDRVEVYVDDTLAGTVPLPSTSTSFFELPLDTTLFPNGNHTILVNAYDKSGNCDNDTVTVFVQNSVHDIAVADVSTSETVIGQGHTLNMDVTFANHGSYTENFNLSVYVNTTCMATQSVTLSSQNYTTFTFAWDTTGFALGNYTISAYAEPLQGETNTADNNFTGGRVLVTIDGDVNGDGKVNLIDVFKVALAYGSSAGDSRYDPNLDINSDGKINLIDYFITALNFGKTI